MKRTKDDRFCELFDVYRKTVGGRPCTIEEVAQWIETNGLWPVPSVRSTVAERTAWEKRLAEFTSLRPPQRGVE